MNEELQREIVNILRAMKDGSPDAFRVLVEQRSLYCWGQVIVAAAGFVVGVMVLWLSSKATCRHYDPAGPTVGSALGVAGSSLASATLWREWIKRERDDRTPTPPWCVSRIMVGSALHMDVMAELGDVARCIAWAWLEGGS